MISSSTLLLIVLVVCLCITIIYGLTLDSLRDILSSKVNYKTHFIMENFSNKTSKDKVNKLLIKKTNNFRLVFKNDKYSVWEPISIDNYHPLGYLITKKNKKPKVFATLVDSTSKWVKKPDKFTIVAITNDNFGIWKPLSNDENYKCLGTIHSQDYPSRFCVRMVHKDFLLKSDIKKIEMENTSMKNDKGYELWSIKDSDYYTCNNKNNVNEYDSLKNIYTLNTNLSDIKKKLYVKYTQSYEKLYSYKDNKLNKDFAIWRPKPPKHFCSLGDIIVKGKQDPNNNLETLVVHKSFCKFPLNYGTKPVITIDNKSSFNHSFWKPQAPKNYHFLGQIFIKGKEEPVDEKLIACIPVDYLENTNKSSNVLVWNNINEENPSSLWVNNLNLVNANNRYVPPEFDGTILTKNLTTSDIDLMDNSKSLLLKYKFNNKYNRPITDIMIKNLLIKNFSQKFDINEDRISIDNIDRKNNEIKITLQSRKIDKNSITVDKVVKIIENTISLDEIRIYTEDKSDFIMTIDNGVIVNKNQNEIILDNSEYVMAF